MMANTDQYNAGWAAYYAGEALDNGKPEQWQEGWLAAMDNEESHQCGN